MHDVLQHITGTSQFSCRKFLSWFFFSLALLKLNILLKTPLMLLNVLLDQMIHKSKKKLGYHHSIREKLSPRLIK